MRKPGIKLGTPGNLKYENRLKKVLTNKLKAKEKLDLGLITKDEYEKKINELKKYIKD